MKAILLIIVTFCSGNLFAQTQQEMNAEAYANYKKAHTEMTSTFKKVMTLFSTDAKAKKILLHAQRAWILFKEAHCKSVANDYNGGSIQPLILHDCLTDVTKQRNTQLENIYNLNNIFLQFTMAC